MSNAFRTPLPALLSLLTLTAAQAQQQAPADRVAFGAHGGMFDAKGNEIAGTAAFIARSQAVYLNALVGQLNQDQRAKYDDLQKRLAAGPKLNEQSKLIVNSRLIDWLIATAKPKDAQHLQAKNNLLKYLLKLPLAPSEDLRQLRSAKAISLDPQLAKRLNELGLIERTPPITYILTTNGGAAYRAECAANGVPVPATVGGTGWTDQGDIPQNTLFIAAGLKARVLTYVSTSPAGFCIALPRYANDPQQTVNLDGVICMGTSTTPPHVCFWDNEKNGGAPNTFPLGTAEPIANFGGGSELVGPIPPGGGVCSDCHSGENPFVIHATPLNTLSNATHGIGFGPTHLGLPTFPPSWPNPIVRSNDTVTWPENPGPMSSTGPTSVVPGGCAGCHTQSGAGRFPHLSPLIASYCNTVLAISVAGSGTKPATMPPGAPGSMASDPDVVAFRNWCGVASTGSTADRGDPHITTYDGRVHYDFQSAGEFTALRNDDGSMEVQTRQTPVGTAGTPLKNDYTGLTSCVSLNTAFAARVGKDRVSYEPNISGVPDPSGMQLRVNGTLTSVGAAGLNLPTGGRILRTADPGGLEIHFPDKSIIVVTPNWWPSQQKWYLNVDVVTTPARMGVMGAVLPGNWLPLLSNAHALGAMPASLHQRHVDLNQTFANSWRVTKKTSLFDYGPGSSTADFTNTAWPVENATSCAIPKSKIPPAKPMDPRRAAEICAPIKDKAMKAECVFDVTVTGEPGFAKTYLRSQTSVARVRAAKLTPK